MVHGVCDLLSSGSGQLQVVYRFAQHQVALTDAVLYNMAACKHVWVSFSTNSDHTGRSRDRGALYQLYSEQPLNVNAFTTPGKFPTHHPLWRSSRFAYLSMLKSPELPPSACGHHLLKTNSTPVCTRPYCTAITAR